MKKNKDNSLLADLLLKVARVLQTERKWHQRKIKISGKKDKQKIYNRLFFSRVLKNMLAFWTLPDSIFNVLICNTHNNYDKKGKGKGTYMEVKILYST